MTNSVFNYYWGRTYRRVPCRGMTKPKSLDPDGGLEHLIRTGAMTVNEALELVWEDLNVLQRLGVSYNYRAHTPKDLDVT